MVHTLDKVPVYFTKVQEEAFLSIYKMMSKLPSAELLIAPKPGYSTIWLVLNAPISSDVIRAIDNATELGVFAIEPISEEEAEGSYIIIR